MLAKRALTRRATTTTRYHYTGSLASARAKKGWLRWRRRHQRPSASDQRPATATSDGDQRRPCHVAGTRTPHLCLPAMLDCQTACAGRPPGTGPRATKGNACLLLCLYSTWARRNHAHELAQTPVMPFCPPHTSMDTDMTGHTPSHGDVVCQPVRRCGAKHPPSSLPRCSGGGGRERGATLASASAGAPRPRILAMLADARTCVHLSTWRSGCIHGG